MNGPVLWVDPGKMTGFAYYTPEMPWNVQIDELPFIEAGDLIEAICQWGSSRLAVGWEHFTIRHDTHKKTADAHHAIEMIGVARRAMIKNNCIALSPAQPGERLVATRKMLEVIGWWRPGKDDAQSAAQHLLSWMLRTGCVPAEVMTSIRSTIQE